MAAGWGCPLAAIFGLAAAASPQASPTRGCLFPHCSHRTGRAGTRAPGPPSAGHLGGRLPPAQTPRGMNTPRAPVPAGCMPSTNPMEPGLGGEGLHFAGIIQVRRGHPGLRWPSPHDWYSDTKGRQGHRCTEQRLPDSGSEGMAWSHGTPRTTGNPGELEDARKHPRHP